MYILIQLIVNIIAVRLLPKKTFPKYIAFSLFIFPLIYFLYITQAGGLIDSGFKGITLDITDLSSMQFYVIISVIILIQIAFGKYHTLLYTSKSDE